MIILSKKKLDKLVEDKLNEKLNSVCILKNDSPKKYIKSLINNTLDMKTPNLKPLLKINFSDNYETLLNIFNNEDQVINVISSLEHSNKETQIIAKLLLENYTITSIK